MYHSKVRVQVSHPVAAHHPFAGPSVFLHVYLETEQIGTAILDHFILLFAFCMYDGHVYIVTFSLNCVRLDSGFGCSIPEMCHMLSRRVGVNSLIFW